MSNENNSCGPLLPCPAAIGELPEAVIDAVATALGNSAYDCLRVWSAWSYGTMGPDDFGLVAEDGERIAEIARAAIEAYVAVTQAVATQAPAAVAVPDGWKLVPMEPQDMQQAAGVQAIRFDTTLINKMWTANKVYREMVASAPECAALAATPALPATEDSSAGDLADWRTPTSYLHRFREAITLVCRGKTPPDNMLTEWLAGDSEELQDFAATHAPSWAQGIGAIEAATVMADQPTEGVEHELRDESQPPAEVQAEPVAWMDDGSLRSGSTATAHRVVTAATKAGMPRAASKSFNTPLYTAPHAQPADALDADGEAFRTAAKLGLTLRFYGGCAQSSKPRTPSAYAEVAGPDPAASMREAVQKVKTTIHAAMAAAQEGGNA